jgi:autotransporter-associated beta strand protein
MKLKNISLVSVLLISVIVPFAMGQGQTSIQIFDLNMSGADRTEGNTAATRIWDGGSAGSGNWTADANWQGNVQPEAGDFLIFPPGALRLSNTNTFGAGTVFGGIIFQGDDYNIYGNTITLTNHITATAGASGNTFRPGIRLGAPSYLRAQGSGLKLTFLGNIDLNGQDLGLVCQPGQLVCSGIISGTGDVTKSGSGRAVFSGGAANTYNGTTYVLDGFLELSKYLILNPGNFRLGRTAVPGNLVIGLGTSPLISDIVVCEANNQIAATAQVTVRATGELSLNDYNHTIFFLRMAGGHVNSGAAMLTVTGNIVGELDDDGSVISGNLNLGPTGKNVILNNDVLLTIPAVVSGASNALLHVSGGGELRLTANNTYAGPTVLHSGAVRVSTPGGLGIGDTVMIEQGELTLANTAINGKMLRASGPGGIISQGSCAWNGDIVLEGDLVVNTSTGSTLVWTGHASGSGGFTKVGAGLLRLSGPEANTFTGGVLLLSGAMELYKFFNGEQVPAISGSTLSVGDGVGGPGADIVRYGGPGQIGDTTLVRVTSSGKVQLAGWTDLIGALTGSPNGGEVDLGVSGARWIVGGNDLSTTFAGTFTGSGSLVKTGATTLTLTGTSTHQREIVVAQGTLLVHGKLLAGSTNSILQVHAQGMLAGTGHVDKVTIFPAGRLAPGASAGILSVSNLWFNDNGQLEIELNGPAPGVGYDRVVAHGAATNYPNGGALVVTLGFVPTAGDSFLILDKTSTGPIGMFNGLPEGATFAAGGSLFLITYTGGDGNDVVLFRLPAPESMLTGLTSLTNGHKRLRGLGRSSLAYAIEAATHLDAPIPWLGLGSATANGAGVFQFTDTNAPQHPRRFYRAISP